MLEEPEQLLQQVAVAHGDDVQRRLLERRARLLVGGETLAAALDGDDGEIQQPVGRRRRVEQIERPRHLRPLDLAGRVAFRLGQRDPGGRAQLLEPPVEIGLVAEGELERPAGRAQRLVDAGQHPPQPGRAVRRQQVEPVGLLAQAEVGERLLERLAAQHPRLAVVEHAEARVEAGDERMRAQQAVTEAVDRRDPGAVELAGEVAPAELRPAARGCGCAARRPPARCR